MKLTVFFYLLYIVLIPLEALIVFEEIGSASRIIGYLLVLFFFIEEKIKFSVVKKEGYAFLLFLILSFIWAQEVDIEQGFRIIMFFFITLITGNLISGSPRVFWQSVDLFSYVVVFLAINTFLGFLNTQDRFDSSELGLAPVSLIFVVSVGLQLILLKITGFSVGKLFLLGLFFLGIIATGTRAAWFASVILLIIFFNQNLSIRLLLSGMLAFFIGYIILYFVFPNAFLFIGDRISLLSDDQGANRLSIWLVALEMWKDKPLLGFGYRNFPFFFNFEYIDRAYLSDLDYNNLTFGGTRAGRGSHSDYVSIIVELGLIGFVLVYSWFRKLFFYFNERKILYMPFIGILIMSFFQDNINQKVFWWILGMATGIPRLKYFPNK
jgi:hypothetical protein